MKMSTLPTIATVLLGLFIAGCSGGEPQNGTSANSAADERIPVKTATVSQKTIALPIHASGFLTSTSEQRPAFKIGGVIKQVLVDEGDFVSPGQLLATLDQTEIAAQVSLAQQALTKAERDLARVEGLFKDSSATLELLQNATTARDVAKENLGIATFNQRYAEIRATTAGRVIKKLMNAGEVVGPGMPLFVIFAAGQNDWVLKINVSDRDWARLQKGMAASAKMDAYPGTAFSGRISDLAPAADPSSGLYPVEVKVLPQGKRFAPGLFAEVDIAPQRSRQYFMVPVEAIVEGDGQEAFVFALQTDRQSVRKVPVKVAFLEGGMAVLADSPADLREVVTAGSPYLSEKTKVVVN